MSNFQWLLQEMEKKSGLSTAE